MSGLERLFLPVYLFIMMIGYLHFFLFMVPGIAVSVLLGRFSGAWVFRRASGERRFRAAMLWDAGAVAVSIFLGRWNGWLILLIQEGRSWGGWLASAGFLAGWLWLHLKRKKEN